MKLILNIREKTLIEDDTDPLGEAGSLMTKSPPDTTVPYCQGRGWRTKNQSLASSAAAQLAT